MRSFSTERQFVMIATNWAGMDVDDQPAVVESVFEDPSTMFVFTDRLHQGFANQLALSYAIDLGLVVVAAASTAEARAASEHDETEGDGSHAARVPRGRQMKQDARFCAFACRRYNVRIRARPARRRRAAGL